MIMVNVSENVKVVELTDAASDKIQDLLERQNRYDLRLRLSVQPGGCSGLIYQLFFDDRLLDGDSIYEYQDMVEIVVDKLSVPYLQGSTVKFEDTIESQGFVLDNPNASSSCACGDSFA